MGILNELFSAPVYHNGRLGDVPIDDDGNDEFDRAERTIRTRRSPQDQMEHVYGTPFSAYADDDFVNRIMSQHFAVPADYWGRLSPEEQAAIRTKIAGWKGHPAAGQLVKQLGQKTGVDIKQRIRQGQNALINPAAHQQAWLDREDYAVGGALSQFEAAHAPAGGVTIGGKAFAGGQFIPGEVMAKASPEERQAVESGEARGKPLPPKTGIVAPKVSPPAPAPKPVDAWGTGGPGDDLIISKGLSPKDAALEIESQKFVRQHYPELLNQYLVNNATVDPATGEVKSITLNTDEWRELIPGYVGSNSPAVHEAAAWCNKRALNDALTAQRGKGNNKFMVLAGGGGSGKGTATGDFFSAAEFPIVLDQVSDKYEKLEGKLDEAIANGYEPAYVFVDRPPADAAGGIVGRAMNLRKKGKPARTVNVAHGLKANIESRKTALDLLYRRPDIEPAVIDNTGRGKRRLITDRAEAIEYLKARLAEDEAAMASGLGEQIRQDLMTRTRSGEIDRDLAEGFLGPNWDQPTASASVPPAPIPASRASASVRPGSPSPQPSAYRFRPPPPTRHS